MANEPDILVPWYHSTERHTIWESGGNPDYIPEYDWNCPDISEVLTY